jgi:hypothetical protein
MRTLRRLILLQLALASALSAQNRPPEPQRAIDWAAIDREAVTLLRDYLRVNSTNPPGNEYAAAQFLRDFWRRRGSRPRSLTPTRWAPAAPICTRA